MRRRAARRFSGDPNAAAYLDGSAAERFDVTRATTVLHRIRYERACRQQALSAVT